MHKDLRAKIVSILTRCRDMTVATVRPDGAPQATIVSFVHDGLTIWFGCGAESQKARNIAAEPRVSVAMAPPYRDWSGIEGLSMAAHAEIVTAPAEIEEAGRLMLARFPQIAGMEPVSEASVAFVRLRPTIVSVLDYAKGFGHADLVRVDGDDIAATHGAMRHRWMIPSGPAAGQAAPLSGGKD